MSSPIKSCSLDPVPTFLLREFVDPLLPYTTRMVNASLEEGRLPISQRNAIVTPLLKRPGLDTADMSNYRPVSNHGFMSKVVERAVAIRLNDYLVGNDLLPRHQSAYRKKHSTETTTCRCRSVTIIKCSSYTINFARLIFGKIITIVATRGQILRLKCTIFYLGWDSAPDPAGGRGLQRSPDP